MGMNAWGFGPRDDEDEDVKMGIGRIKVQFSEDGEKWRLPRMETDERGKL